jgi:DNA-binding NtrC family response regulator
MDATRNEGHDNRPQILLVEEETHEREALREHLAQAGYAVRCAENSDDALALLAATSSIAGIVTDAHVPGRIDGFELAALVRKEHPHLAVVMTSGHSDSSSGPVPDGALFIGKPNLLEYLVPALHRLIDQTREPDDQLRR